MKFLDLTKTEGCTYRYWVLVLLHWIGTIVIPIIHINSFLPRGSIRRVVNGKILAITLFLSRLQRLLR